MERVLRGSIRQPDFRAGRGKYLGVYVNIMRGEYDALLAWPFNHKVTVPRCFFAFERTFQITISLMDQDANYEKRTNIDYVIRPIASRENKVRQRLDTRVLKNSAVLPRPPYKRAQRGFWCTEALPARDAQQLHHGAPIPTVL